MGARQRPLEDMGIVADLQNTFKSKKVFITGHTGFKGSWLLLLLHELGAKIKGYSLAPEEHSLFSNINGDNLCFSVFNDIRNLDALKHEIKAFEPDFIFHLAAQALVRLSYQIPVDTFETNTLGTLNLLESVRELPNSCVVVLVTTDKVYENQETGHAFKETDPLGGHDPYSASKAAAEIIISSYRNSFFNAENSAKYRKSVSSARAGNVIGGGDWSKDRLIPDLIQGLYSSGKVNIRNPRSVRPWQHVLEPLVGYLILAAKQYQQPEAFNGAWNFGPELENSISVEEIVKLAINLLGFGDVAIDESPRPYEAQLLHLNINKAKQLGWKPLLTLNETIHWTLDWYLKIRNGEASAEQLVKMQIQTYLNLLK